MTGKKLYSLILLLVVVSLFFVFVSSTTLAMCGEPSIDVKTDSNWIVVKETGYPDGGSDIFSNTGITITVTDPNGNPMPNTKVSIRAITVPGSGGHTHDMDRSPESQTYKGVTRPMANLIVGTGTLVDKKANNDIIVKTDSLGIVRATYTPPYVIVGSSKLKRVIGGIDSITVSLVDYPEIKKVLKIGVGYPDFISFSDKNVEKQDNHGYEFWCTTGTDKSIKDIAKRFKEKTGRTFTITAMSLPYGGLSDINGNWKAPHVGHSNGKCVDIGVTYMSSGDRETLRQIIHKVGSEDHNLRRLLIEVNEKTKKPYCYHISFKS